MRDYSQNVCLSQRIVRRIGVNRPVFHPEPAPSERKKRFSMRKFTEGLIDTDCIVGVLDIEPG
jgi:hypothetical protein